ncbi:MAG: sugar MFS transporter [Niabella sp.]|nr:sugar MFS transporter [Niabella sp.]
MNIPYRKAIVSIGLLFFVFGFITWLCSILIPYLQLACELNNFQAQLVSFAFYISYFVMAIPAGKVLKKTGFKNGIALGLLVMALGSLLFIPGAFTRQYWIFLTGLFIQGIGLAILQTASNPYVAILGPRESAARRMSIMGICNGVAGILAPLILGRLVLADADATKIKLEQLGPAERLVALENLATRVINPYLVIFAGLLLLSFWFFRISLPEPAEEEDDAASGSTTAMPTSILSYPHLILGVLTLFVYVGVEVIAGNTIIGYASSVGIPMAKAQFFTSLTLLCMLLGYLIGIICIPKIFSQTQGLKASAVLGILFAGAAIGTHGTLSVIFIALLGLANSLMWPSIWPLAIADLGSYTKTGSALLVMAIAGGAVIPLLYGKLSDSWSPAMAYWIVLPCYLMIAFYGWYGHKIRIKQKTDAG